MRFTFNLLNINIAHVTNSVTCKTMLLHYGIYTNRKKKGKITYLWTKKEIGSVGICGGEGAISVDM